ncbi:Myosin regulatory light polypeptide 9 [Chamberlinius hualienensis]
MASTAAKKKSGGSARKAQRATSNVFALFDQTQIQEFKEAFQLVDSNKDGFIDKEDLRSTFDSLGRLVPDNIIESMIAEAPGPINFTMFLSIFGERISGADPEDVIVNAFKAFDTFEDGLVDENNLRRVLGKWGDRFTQTELDQAFNEAPVDREGKIDYKAYSRLITRGKEDDETVQA